MVRARKRTVIGILLVTSVLSAALLPVAGIPGGAPE